MSAVCVRCGGLRTSFRAICPICGHRAEGEGLQIAWLLSSEHLDAAQLENAAEKIRSGKPLKPSRKMLERARRALGTTLESDPGLPGIQVVGLLCANVLLTPLLGWTLWLWWRDEHPRAALQALLVSVPVSVLGAVVMVGSLFV